jgi:hypothetical protein
MAKELGSKGEKYEESAVAPKFSLRESYKCKDFSVVPNS